MASIESHTTNKGQRIYTVRFRDPAHRQQQKTFQRKVDAERFRNAVEASKDQGTYIDARGTRGMARQRSPSAHEAR
jgi:hypothetical protein